MDFGVKIPEICADLGFSITDKGYELLNKLIKEQCSKDFIICVLKAHSMNIDVDDILRWEGYLEKDIPTYRKSNISTFEQATYRLIAIAVLASKSNEKQSPHQIFDDAKLKVDYLRTVLISFKDVLKAVS